MKKDIVNSISNLNTKLKIENLTNENKRLKTELINAKIKIFSSKVLLEKNKVELSEKLTKVDKTDKINTNLKDTVSIVSDDKNIGVLTSVDNIVIDYILKPKKETPAKDSIPLQINYYNFHYNILNCRYIRNPFLIWTIRNSKNIIFDRPMENYINVETALTKRPNINFNSWWTIEGLFGGVGVGFLFYWFCSKKIKNKILKKMNK